MTSKFVLLLVVSIFSIKVFSLNVTAQNKSPNYHNYSVATLKTKAQNKDLKAQNELGVRYFYGYRGVSEDKAKAEYWLKKAADNGLGEACANMGRLIYSPYDEKGIYYLRKGTSLNDGKSYYGLFLSYKYGDLANRNEDLARKMLMKSANLGYSQGCNVIAMSYQYGSDGFLKDKNQAIFWYKRACDSYYEEYPDGEMWEQMQKRLQDLGCDYDPSMHVEEYKAWLKGKSTESQYLADNTTNSNSSNTTSSQTSSQTVYHYIKSGRGQSQTTGQWTDAIESENCAVEFYESGISVNMMWQPYVKTSGIWNVYGGTSIEFRGFSSTYYYYVDGNKNMMQVCESFSPYYGFDTTIYPMSRNGDPTPGGNTNYNTYNGNSNSYQHQGGTSTNSNSGSTRQFKCAYCNGTGRIERNDNAPASFGQTRANKRCTECGKVYDPTVFNHYHVQCGHCGGTGKMR